ncbi:MAG: PD-(D/E)XK nuclease family protein [Bacteroidetes bacterium]|nr:PD-(D/E)XK nuclease family protein [Bacteroidota bacterium]MCL5025138.1 PD-(D/E)XK nuclease family protein [Chloroflexota bacterium]
MAPSLFRLSPYKLAIFRQCPRRYKYHYVDGLLEQYRKPRPYLTMGAHIHDALRDFFSPRNLDRSYATMEALLRRRWSRNRNGFADNDEEKQYGLRALEQLKWFCDRQDTRAQPFLLEAYHSVILSPELLLKGKIDRVDRHPDGSLHVIDYKTGKTPKEDGDFQLLAYALLLQRKLKSEVAKASYLYLNGDGLRSIEPTPAQIADTEARLHAAREEILSEREFAPRPNWLCGWCDFAGLCDAENVAPADGNPPDEPGYW